LSLTLVESAVADELAGTFEGDGLRLELERDEDGYEGFLDFQEQSFPCQARRSGTGLSGSFDSGDGSFPFEMRPEGAAMVLTSGGVTYRLQRVGGGNPLAGDGGGNPLAGGSGGGGGSSAAATGFDGRFQGSIQGTAAVLTLQRQGNTVNGGIDASGYPYQLQGTVSGNSLTGQLMDPQTGGGFNIEATLRGDALELVLLTQQGSMPLSFQRVAAGGGSTGAGGHVGGGTQAAPQGQRDPALVGVWRQSESMSGGGTSMVVESFLRINPDGSFALGGGRAVGGGANWGGDTGSGGVDETGFWKTENRVVYVQSAGGGGWQPYARYYAEATKLMFTFGDESRQIWYRVQ
jgi:hypothetical protein